MTRGARALRAPGATPPVAKGHSAQAVPVIAASNTSVAFQAARAQLLLDRIAAASDVTPGASDDPGTVDQLLRTLDDREALLTGLEPMVAELTSVRGQLGGLKGVTAEARLLDLVLAPAEQAAQRALGCQAMLLAKMQAMRDELKAEVDRLGHVGARAQAYLDHAAVPARAHPPRRLDGRR